MKLLKMQKILSILLLQIFVCVNLGYGLGVRSGVKEAWIESFERLFEDEKEKMLDEHVSKVGDSLKAQLGSHPVEAIEFLKKRLGDEDIAGKILALYLLGSKDIGKVEKVLLNKQEAITFFMQK
ncbi:hypothetical protein KKC59_03365, partial [bacterium]|nr:hypothetical protein [bacterium]